MRLETAARLERVDKRETHAMRLYINIDNRTVTKKIQFDKHQAHQ